GRTAAELRGKPLAFLSGDSNILAAARSRGGAVEEDRWYVRHDDTKLYLRTSLVPLGDSFLVHLYELAREGERAPLEPAIEPFRLMVQGVKDYAIFMLDSKGHVNTWNEG